MAFTVSLYAAVFVFLAGLVYRISRWFKRRIGATGRDITPWARFREALSGIGRVIASRKIFVLIKVFVLEILFQRKILKESPLRWVMHLLIYYGFILLLLMHALGEVVTANIFTDYFSTVNPFFFLRDFFGLVVTAGLAIAVYRRFILKVPRMHSNGRDIYGIVILAVIMLSGFFLTGLKITSHSVFNRMVQDFSIVSEGEEEYEALESLWVKEFGLVSPNVEPPFDDDFIEMGREVHDMDCAFCHSRPQWSPGGFAVAKGISPFAGALDRAGVTGFMWWLHILACLVGLAYVPFSKMSHIIFTPLNILVNAVTDRSSASAANIATIQSLELDACMHCSTCSLRCSAATVYEARGNDYILPGEKMQILRELADGKPLGDRELDALAEGVYLCTNCDRCTVVCPAGISLKDLWVDVREELIHRPAPVAAVLSPYSLLRGLKRGEGTGPYDYLPPIERANSAAAGGFDAVIASDDPLDLTLGEGRERPPEDAGSFAYCFGCRTCTTVCPVVAAYDNPEEVLGLLPHQIMCAMGLGLSEVASGARMIWDCVTCYQCQEHCPQKVCVTDVLYQLKNMAAERAGAVSSEDSPAEAA
jgi:heterodisulfide reductase subunit C/nitrate reductase gamma subunit